MYIFILGILLLFSLLSIKVQERLSAIMFHGIFIVLTLGLCLRYGQGTDYFGYNWIFLRFNTVWEAIKNLENIHSEMGFRIICSLFDKFEWLVFAISVFEMMMLYMFIRKRSSNGSLSLLLFFHTAYLTYYFSALREGIVLAAFLGIMVGLAEKKKWKWYLFVNTILVLFHNAAIALFFIPIASKVKKEYLSKGIIFSAIIGVLMCLAPVKSIFMHIPVLVKFMRSNDIQILSLLERTVMYCVVRLLYSSTKYRENDNIHLWMTIYTIGFELYLILMPFSLLASRLVITFKTIEIVIIPRLIADSTKYRTVALCIVIAASTVMSCKNISSYISQGQYKSGTTVFNYPYISVFDKHEIWNYRHFGAFEELVD